MVTSDYDVAHVGHGIVNVGLVNQSLVGRSASSGWLDEVTIMQLGQSQPGHSNQSLAPVESG